MKLNEIKDNCDKGIFIFYSSKLILDIPLKRFFEIADALIDEGLGM